MGNLSGKLKFSRLSEEEVRFYGGQFAKGLKYLHDQKILHRDLKLSNLLLTDKDVVVYLFKFLSQLLNQI